MSQDGAIGNSSPLFIPAIERLESEWQRRDSANIAKYLDCSASIDIIELHDLIELDLEYRWKRFERIADKTSVDAYGFRNFPIIEDYGKLIPERRQDVVTPRLLAEEYRVRVRWGDRPSPEEISTRLSDRETEVDAAIAHVEVELQREHAGSRFPQNGVETPKTSSQLSTVNYHSSVSIQNSTRPPCLFLDRYRMESLVGRGGFGEVWRAFDPELDRQVAIKMPRSDIHLSEKLISDFKKEGKRLAKLGPIPGIVAVFDIGEWSGRPYLVSEFIEGGSLADQMQQRAWSHDEVASLIASAAAALHRAHTKGLVHRDIKPGNILLKSDGTPVIADFGLAVSEREQLAEIPGAIGTVAYMAPEQFRGDSHLANPQADIFSLGVILYQMLTGRLPFVADSIEEYRNQLLHRPVWPLRSIDDSIPPELARICSKCLVKDPNGRYTAATDLRHDLEKYFQQEAKSRMHRRRLLGVFGLLGLTCGVGWIANRQWRPQDEPLVSRLIPFQELSPGEIQVGQWYPLLTIEPITIQGPVRPGNGKHFDSASQSLHLSTDVGSLFSLGIIAHKNFSVRADIKYIGPWRGHAGLFLNLPDVIQDRTTQGIIVSSNTGRDSGKCPVIVSRRRIRVLKDYFLPKEFPSDITNEVKTAGVTPGRSSQLMIKIVKGRLVSMRWSGFELSILCEQELNNQFPSPTGLFGLIAWGASGVTFNSVEIRIDGTESD
ncbi:MAG: serine/threonine protein kinase [Planctomycetaceae bacterium]|nr:serine/threonine protein kinase [Planctomycetaceae bacterium]